MKQLSSLLLTIFLALVLPLNAAPPSTLTFTTIDVPGATSSEVDGINDAGQMVGRYLNGSGFHGFVLDHGAYTTLDVPGASLTHAFGINSAGDIVGDYVLGDFHGFLLNKGTVTTIDVPGATSTFA